MGQEEGRKPGEKDKKLTWALSLAGELEPSGMSATPGKHKWTRVTLPVTKQKWCFWGMKRIIKGKLYWSWGQEQNALLGS